MFTCAHHPHTASAPTILEHTEATLVGAPALDALCLLSMQGPRGTLQNSPKTPEPTWLAPQQAGLKSTRNT